MKAGELRKELTLQKPVWAKVRGSLKPTWTDVTTVRAGVFPFVGKEYHGAKQEQSEVTHKIVMRWRGDIQPSWRLKLGNQVFDIESVINIKEENRELVIYAIERARGG